jgi:phospholipid/cholesterol/gamma-HCH transport system ATP-binding protein
VSMFGFGKHAARTAGPKPAPSEMVVLRRVTKRYDDTEVIKGIDMIAAAGETTVIIGSSGAGKTTLLRMIVALEPPTSGDILIDGESIVGMTERELNGMRRKLGMVYQYAALLDSRNVLDNIAFPLQEHLRLSEKEVRDRVFKKMRDLGLAEDTWKKFPAELSGGMRKRVGIARALILEPKILVYDEPTSGLDPVTSRTVDDLIEEMRARLGVTSIVISHDIASCFRIAHQALLLIGGQIVARGRPDELAHGDCAVARDFIEKSGVNVTTLDRVARPTA